MIKCTAYDGSIYYLPERVVELSTELWAKHKSEFTSAIRFGRRESPRGKKCTKCSKRHYGICQGQQPHRKVVM